MSMIRAAAAENRLAFIGTTNLGDCRPDVVGSKAANLMRMADAGLAVPAGFVLPTGLCADYHARGGQFDDAVAALVSQGVSHLEQATGMRFGADRRPLLVAVRSGAAVSMPGMLDTILNVGLCDATLPGLLRATGDPVFVWDSYRRLIQSYAEVVEGTAAAPFAGVLDTALDRHGVPSVGELDVAALRDVAGEFQDVYRAETSSPFPQDPRRQLLGAVEAVLRSWTSDRAREYRRLEGLEALTGTAVTVQAMVFGNTGGTSGSGVGFTRDPATGQDRLYVDFLLNAQGEDVVGGRHSARDPELLIAAIPGLAHELQRVRRTLEAVFGDAQDFEFTVEEGKLWLLQTRAAKRTPWAALQIACDLVDEGLIDPKTALERLRPYDLDRIARVRLSPGTDVEPIGRGTPASAGVACGLIALDVEAALRLADRGEPVVLVREQASTDDVAALAVCRGLLTATGARTSHAAVVARQLGVACLVNCADLSVDLQARRLAVGTCWLDEGDPITIDGADGWLYTGALDVVEDRPTALVERVRAWEQDGPASARRDRSPPPRR
jgi:pyruvate,orthophosphate dikinase